MGLYLDSPSVRGRDRKAGTGENLWNESSSPPVNVFKIDQCLLASFTTSIILRRVYLRVAREGVSERNLMKLLIYRDLRSCRRAYGTHDPDSLANSYQEIRDSELQ